MKKAVVLLSGGLDSATCLAIAREQGYTCYALSFRYGQRHDAELNSAQAIAQHWQVEHRVIDVPALGQWKGSALTDPHCEVPDYVESTAIPVTYVPARNTIFLSLALGYAEIIGAYDIFIGANAIDYSGYPDCRPEFIAAFEQLANLGTKAGIEFSPFCIHTPLMKLTKAQTIELGTHLKVDYQMTVSCYQANSAGEACGRCDSCTYRKKGFMEAGIVDPTRYRALA